MEIADDGGQRRMFTCYTAPGCVFESEEEMKDHYRSEWHRQNLRRKVAGLPPLSKEAHEAKMAREPKVAEPDGMAGASRSTQRRCRLRAASPPARRGSSRDPAEI